MRPTLSGVFGNIIALDALQVSKGLVFQSGLQFGKADEVMRIARGNGTSVLREGQKDLRSRVRRVENRIAGVSLQMFWRERVFLSGDKKRFKFRQGFRLLVQQSAHTGNPFGVRESQDGVFLVVDDVVALLLKVFHEVGDLLSVGRRANDLSMIFFEGFDP